MAFRRLISGRGLGWALGWLVMWPVISCAAADSGNTAQMASGTASVEAVAEVVKGIVSYTRWPRAADSHHLCLIAHPLAGPALLAGWSIPGDVPVQTSQPRIDDPGLGTRCDIIYAGVLNAELQSRLRSALAGHPVLTIVDTDPGCSGGSMFCLKIAAAHVGFDINLDAVSRSGVRVHPSVLRLSTERAWP